MEFTLSDEQLKQRTEFFEVCQELERQKPPGFAGFGGRFMSDEGWKYHLQCLKEFARRGWISLGWPSEYGGKGTIMDRVLFAEARGYCGVAGIDGVGVGMLAPTLLQVGTEELKKKYLPPIAAGEVTWAELWSEPNAGSDLASLKSTAIRKGDEYVVNGEKIWVAGARRADWGFAILKSDLAAPKHHNLTFLLLDMKTPGVAVVPMQYMHGGYRYDRVYFDNVHVPVKNIVGQENEGWAVVNVLAGFERSHLDEIMTTVRGLDDLVAYCNKVERNGRLLAKDPLVRNRLAQAACEIEAARTLGYYVADQQSRGEMSLIDAAAVKIYCSELNERIAFLAMDILGHHGQVKVSRHADLNGVWQYLCQESFAFTIAGGSNEIQRNIIAWYGLRLPRMK
jgi:alkylation response protein AidB-like acyl-CoA dehydrogenase